MVCLREFLLVIGLAVSAAAYSPIIDYTAACESENMFACKNGQCLPTAWQCDGEPDCKQGEDELNCADKLTSEDDRCNIASFFCDGSCRPTIPFLCNGIPDCEDGADELACDGLRRPTCEAGYYSCSGTCVPGSTYRCDGVRDCAGGNDEMGCYPNTPAPIIEPPFPPCPPGHLSCGTAGECFEVFQRCDSQIHCSNLADEMGCPSDVLVSDDCAAGEIRCFDRKCIDVDRLCDGFQDCDSGEDEFGCDYNPAKFQRFQCLKVCVGLPVDTYCNRTRTPTLQPSTAVSAARKGLIHTCDNDTFPIQSKCISVHITPPVTWSEAWEMCRRTGGHLLEISNGNFFLDLVAHLNSTSFSAYTYYVGANDMTQEGRWTWDSSQSVVAQGTPMWGLKLTVGDYFTAKLIQEPAGGNSENCGILSNCPYRYLADVPCSERHGFICERPAHLERPGLLEDLSFILY